MRLPTRFILLAVLLTLPVTAQVYKVVDNQGRITYTDEPPKDDRTYEKVELKTLNRQQAIDPVPSLAPQFTAPNRDSDAEEAVVDYNVQVTGPAQGAHVPPGQRDLPVAAQVSPSLAEDHGVQFLLNGDPLAPPSQDMGLVIEEIYRGEHRITARVLGPEGEVLAESEPVQFFVHRPTVNSPAR